MAGLESIVQALPVISQGVNIVSSAVRAGSTFRDDRRQQDLALQQLAARQNLELQNAAQDAALDRQRLALQAEQDEEDRRRALKRAVARQRANFAGQGVGAAAGSSQAVLLGLFDESDEDRRQRESLDRLRSSAIDTSLGQVQRVNVLQQTQLRERQRIGGLTRSLDLGQDFFDTAVDTATFGSQFV
jgi:hypothetical protein